MKIEINGPKLEQIANELEDIYSDIENSIANLEQTSKVIDESDFKTIFDNNPIINEKIKEIRKDINSEKDFLPTTINEINIIFKDVEEKSKKAFQISLGDKLWR